MVTARTLRSRDQVAGFSPAPVSRKALLEILRAGTGASAGLNNQPWRFVLVQDAAMRSALAGLVPSLSAAAEAAALLVVLADYRAMAHFTLDYQAVGACLQNMLLAARALGLGAAWCGTFLYRAAAVQELLDLPDCLELMAVVAVGHPCRTTARRAPRPLKEVLIKEF